VFILKDFKLFRMNTSISVDSKAVVVRIMPLQILKDLAARILREIGCSRSIFEEKKKEKYNDETP